MNFIIFVWPLHYIILRMGDPIMSDMPNQAYNLESMRYAT